jgi:hypothetical protein
VDLVTLESVLEEALRRGDVTITRLNWQLKTSGGKGVPGSKALRRLLADRPSDYRPLRSDLELRVLRAILRAGLPRPVHEHPVTLPNGIVIRPDFSYPDRKIAIECQSFRYHGGRQIWLRDVDRFNGLRRVGWTVIQVTPESLEREEAALMAELRQLLCR